MKPQPTPLARDNSNLPASLRPGGWGGGDSPATQPFKAVLVGNPNVGKTTLHNAMVRARRPTGNYPGVTVEQASGRVRLGSNSFELLDLPGTYGLADNSPEGRAIQDALAHEEPAAIVNVTDATQLERHLYLTTELLELGRPVVVALNFWDLALKQGLIIDVALLSRLLRVPVVPTIGRTGVGIELLLTRVAQACHSHAQEPFPEIDPLREQIAGGGGEEAALTSASRRYDYVKRLCARVVSPAATIAVSRSERIDRVLMGRWFGLPFFGLIMYLVFQLTFTVAQPWVGGMETGFAWLQDVVSACWHPTSESAFRSLLVDGMIGGVGGVAIFVPNLLLLFLCLALLEQSGYMVRAMFVLDRLFHRFGVSGKSFIPMLIGFGCTVPAIMATRTLGTRGDRLATILVLPLISCSARLPIYILVISAFFPNRYQAPILWAVYMTGILLAIAVGRLIRFSLFKGASSSFIMEVPPYRMPALGEILRQLWDRIWSFLKTAGTIILGVSILLWALSVWPQPPADQLARFGLQRAALLGRQDLDTEAVARRLEDLDTEIASRQLEHSAIGRVGRALAPVFRPLGFDWKMTTALLGTLAARELFLAQMAVIHAVGNAGGQPQTLKVVLRQNYTPLQGISLMLFCMLGPPCLATFAEVASLTTGRTHPVGLCRDAGGLSTGFLLFCTGLLKSMPSRTGGDVARTGVAALQQRCIPGQEQAAGGVLNADPAILGQATPEFWRGLGDVAGEIGTGLFGRGT